MWLGHLINMSIKRIYFYKEMRIIVIKQNNISILSIYYKSYKIFILIKNPVFVLINRRLGYIKILISKIFINNINLITFVNVLLEIFYKYFLTKISFIGKGYYLYKSKRNVLGLQFNYSHKVNLYMFYLYIYRYSKRSWLFFNLNKSELLLTINKFKFLRPINIYTLRGIRFKEQIIYKKKISS